MISGILASRCGTGLSKNALGVDDHGNLGLFQSGSPGAPNVTWYLGVGFDASGNPLGAYFKNKQSGGYLYGYYQPGYLAPSLGIGPLSVLDGWSTWSFGSPRNDGYLAVRPVANDDFNLNILGGCDGTDVGLWGWSGGDSNEIWIFAPDPVPPTQPSKYRIYSKCGGFMGVDASNRVFYQPLIGKVLGALPEPYPWQVEVAMGRTPVQKIPYPLSGLSIINPALNKAVKSNGSGQAVTFVDLGSVDQSSAWNTNGSNAGYMALRPLADDDQNLNISGGCRGSQIVTYDWTGGNANEMWQFRPQ